MESMRIALLDDDPNQSDLVCQALTAAGHSCQAFMHDRGLLAGLDKDGFDLLIINSQACGNSGVAILQSARTSLAVRLPALFITGRAGEDGIVAALDAGADDYIIKPVRRGELLTRVRVLLRRAYPDHNDSEEIRFGQYLFETQTSRLRIAGRRIDLTQKEFALALLFFRNLGRPLSRAYILDAVWPGDSDIPSRTMDTHVSRVRNKLGLRKENGFRLAPVYGYGYRLEQLTS
jgi:DNA-binding response OmpR family regulator